MLWLFSRFSLWNCTNKNIKLAPAPATTTAAAKATRIQFNLLTWRLNSAGSIKIPNTTILQLPPNTTAQHVTQWSQSFTENFDFVDR
jgi:hypothetical protein